MLKRTFNLNLTPRELAGLMFVYGTDAQGNINPSEFISSFVRLGIDQRYKNHHEHIARLRSASKAAKEEASRKLAVQSEKLDIKIDMENHTEEDRIRALSKLTEAAERYDRMHPAAPNVEGFSGLMPPAIFKEMLRRTFNISLTPKEGGALAKYFSDDSNGNVPGEKFLINFIQIGVDARNRAANARREKQRKAEQDAEEEKQRKARIAMQQLTVEIDLDYTAADHKSAWEKVSLAAARYDKTHPGAVSVKGFESAYVTPLEFKELLKRTFHLRLSPAELGVIVSHFDHNKQHRINCQEFLVSFQKLGAEERAKHRSTHVEAQRSAAAFKKQEHARKMKEIQDTMEQSVEVKYTAGDEKSAFEKLAEAAKSYDRYHPSSPSLEAFQAAYLTPGVLRDVLRRTFNVRLTGAEAGAMVAYFDHTKEGLVYCHDFLTHFFKIGASYRNRAHTESIQKRKEHEESQQREKEEKLAAQWAKLEQEIDFSYTEADKESALRKLSEAARDYDPKHSSAQNMSVFDVAVMSPAVFRDTLKRVLNIRLSHKETGALVSMFPKEGQSKVVNCDSFIKKFVTLSLIEKDKIRETQRILRREIQEKSKNEAAVRRKAFEDRIEIALDLDFTKEDFHSGLEKIRMAAAHYDRLHPAAVGLDAFMGASLTAGQFREQMKRVFNVILTPKELAAIVKFFEHDNGNGNGSNSGEISCPEFLQHFIRLQRQERNKASRSRQEWNRAVEDKIREEETQKYDYI